MTNEIAVAQPRVIDLGPSPSQNNSAIAAIESSRAMQEVMASILAAKRFPRDEVQAERRILAACLRPGLAAKAVYSYPRGGSDVTGPSIRLAEVLAQNWGNLKYDWQEIERRHGESTIRAFCWDKETNVDASITFTVKHVRDKWVDKKDANGNVMRKPDGKPVKFLGTEPVTDERSIYEVCANQAARRKRACILALIPKDITDAAVSQCEKTLEIDCPVTPESLASMLKAFSEFGINKEMLEDFLGRNYDSVAPAQLVRFRTIFLSLKDGIAKADDFFDLELADKKEELKVPEGKKPAPEKKTLETLKAKQVDSVNQPADTKTVDNITAVEKRPDKCLTCNGRGIIEDKDGKQPCLSCNGKGK